MTQEKTIAQLEEKLAHQQLMLDEMSGQLHDQWRQIEQMRGALESLGTRFVALEEATAPTPENTKPPHY